MKKTEHIANDTDCIWHDVFKCISRGNNDSLHLFKLLLQDLQVRFTTGLQTTPVSYVVMQFSPLENSTK